MWSLVAALYDHDAALHDHDAALHDHDAALHDQDAALHDSYSTTHYHTNSCKTIALTPRFFTAHMCLCNIIIKFEA